MLKINIGHSRKIGEPNYGSRGASVKLELEADTALLADPDHLQEKIRWLFSLAKQSNNTNNFWSRSDFKMLALHTNMFLPPIDNRIFVKFRFANRF